jgi:hypothetical protein
MRHIDLRQGLDGGGGTLLQYLARHTDLSFDPPCLCGMPGSVVREVCELATWFEQVYDSNRPQGIRDAWHNTVTAMEMHSTGVTQLVVMESFKVVLPSSLNSRSLNKPVTFCSNNSHPMTFTG